MKERKFETLQQKIMKIKNTNRDINEKERVSHTHTHTHTPHPLFGSRVEKRVPPKRDTGPRRCVYPNPSHYMKIYAGMRTSEEYKRNTHTHLRGPEKLARTYGYIWKKRDDETGGRKRNRYQLQCQAIGVLLQIVLKKDVSGAKDTHIKCTSKVVS